MKTRTPVWYTLYIAAFTLLMIAAAYKERHTLWVYVFGAFAVYFGIALYGMLPRRGGR